MIGSPKLAEKMLGSPALSENALVVRGGAFLVARLPNDDCPLSLPTGERTAQDLALNCTVLSLPKRFGRVAGLL